MKVGYLVNIYPRVTHSFIRREIQAVEKAGLEVKRFSIRKPPEALVDPADLIEFENTKFILGVGVLGLLIALGRTFLRNPFRFISILLFTLRIGIKSDRGVGRNLAYLAEACVLLCWTKRENIDHIHAHFGINSTTVAMLCRLLGGSSYSFTVHGPEEFDRVESIALPEKITHALFVAAISTFAKSQLYRWCSYEDYAKIHVVRCGVDDMFLSQQCRPIGRDPTLVCVGRLCTHKAQLLIVEAANCLRLEGLDLKVVLVGGGPTYGELVQLIKELNLQDVVEITGWADSSVVQQKLLEARAMVLPSFAEGLPVVIMEALGLGRPVVTTYVAGIPELVESGECGWVVTPGDLEELKTAMREVIESPVESLETMGQKGAQRVATMHDATKEGAKLAELFKTAILQAQ